MGQQTSWAVQGGVAECAASAVSLKVRRHPGKVIRAGNVKLTKFQPNNFCPVVRSVCVPRVARIVSCPSVDAREAMKSNEASCKVRPPQPPRDTVLGHPAAMITALRCSPRVPSLRWNHGHHSAIALAKFFFPFLEDRALGCLRR